MESAVTKSMTIATVLVALTLATAIAAASGSAQARFGIGIGAGRQIGSAYGDPAFAVNAGYDECRFVDRTDRAGNVSTFKICDVVPY
jgi:hypothetical protein